MDPSTLGPRRIASIGIEAVSPGGEYLIYGLRNGREDEVTVHVMDIDAAANLPDGLPRARCTATSRGRTMAAVSTTARGIGSRAAESGSIAWGRDAGKDETFLGEGCGPDKFAGVIQIADGRHLLYDVWHGWSSSELHLQDLRAGGPPRVLAGPDLDTRFRGARGILR